MTRFTKILPLLLVPALACGPGDDGQEADVRQQDHEQGHIALTEEQFAAAGIELQTAGPARVWEALTLPGSVAPNADAVLHVTPRVAGQAREVFKHLGAKVEPGELLCIIDSVELGDAAADYLRDREMVAAAEETLERERGLYAKRLEALTSLLDGSIAVHERIHEREQDLQERAVSTVRPLLEADKALQAAKLQKQKQLTELEAERDARLLVLDVDLRVKRIDLAAARNRLRTLGIAATGLEGLAEDSPLLSGEYRVFAAGAGVVVDRHVSSGEFVEAGSRLFVIEDLSSVWFVASAFEGQLQSVRTAQTAFVSIDAFPGTRLEGVVSFLDYRVDAISRSVGVRIELDNPRLDGWPEELPLRPGMFGRVEVETASRAARIALPERALVHDDERDYVFVQVEPLVFERRDVVAKHAAEGMVEIVEGLEPGESVAVSGTFLLKSAERRGELGGEHGH